ncbi:MAG TPA: TetR family transcriptional regulator [Gammaproteobacteria bacterium]|jgi:TetR/AcrR family transcriptional repressor of nem operon|nr:TetR family transcriptional regulator [Gammaproteobacteria bacterium]
MARPKKFPEERVLDAITDVFWQRGFEATSAQDLVDATGLPRSSLYNAYVNKQGLFEHALMHYKRRTEASAAALDAADSKRDAIHALLADAVNADLSSRTRRGCLVTNTAIEHGNSQDRVTELVRKNLKTLEDALTRNIQAGQASGEIASRQDAQSLAACILTTLQGLRVLAKTTPKTQRMQLIRTIETTLDALL